MPFPELYFNVDNGYLEGLVRGFKAGILSQGDYLNLVQCETLEGEYHNLGLNARILTAMRLNTACLIYISTF
uniref:Uncharacterized protein n=1 Tax=Anguilla anguilla TaxID=7936 RepID=A0A0E9SNT9_ANGAN